MKKSAFFLLLTAFYAGLVFGQNHRGTARVLRFPTSEKVSFAAFRRGDTPLKFTLPAGDSLALQSARTDGSGRRRYRLQQMHGGIPVFGAEGIFLEENGALSWGKGRFRQRIDAGTSPVISEKAAFERALAAMPAEKYAWQEPAYERELKTASADPAASFFPKGKLVFLPDDLSDPSSGGVRLAWQFDVFAAAPEPVRQLVFVDARDGKILRSIPLMHSGHVPAKGFARYVSDTVAFNTESLPGDTLYRLRDLIRNILVRDALNLQSNPNADFVHNGAFWGKPEHRTPVAAHWGMKQWYDYMLQTHGWRGFANDSTPMMAWARFGHNFNNAFWNGNWVNFGDGDGIRFGPLVQLDIVAHECAHALVQNTCGLIYQGEPGALNEGLCDIFATLVERYVFPDTWNWKLGEAAYFDHANGLRRLDYPNVTGHPDTYGGQFWVNTEGCAPGVTNDQCGIHANCGVLGKFFYILAQGESGVSEAGMPYNVSGIGMNKAAEIIFLAMDDYLLPTDGFADMRTATLEAAYKLYPGTEAEVAKAWCAVGVGECTVSVSDSIVLKSPAAVDTFQHGQPIEVLWTATAGVEKVNLYLSLNDGASWQLIHANLEAAGGQFEFPAPPVFSPVCRLRLADAENPFVSDRGDTTFVITGCGLKAHFIPSVTKVCYGQPFYAVNDSPEKDVYFYWRWNGTNFPSPDSLLEIPAMTLAGEHLIELIADDSAGCRDTFGLRVTVLPQVTAAFSAETHGNTLVANAHYQGADTYVWLFGGKQVGGNSPALTQTGLTPGTDSLRLIVAENGCPGGVAEAVEGVTVDITTCTGDSIGYWKQFAYTNSINGIAEQGDTLWLATDGGLIAYSKKNDNYTLFNNANSGLSGLPVTAVIVTKDGKVMAGTHNGVAVYDHGNWTRITPANAPVNLPIYEKVDFLEIDDAGNIWIAFVLEHRIVKWGADNTNWNFDVGPTDIRSIQARNSELFICTAAGLKKINNNHALEDVNNPGFPVTSFQAIALDYKNNLWLGKNSIVIKFNPETQVVTQYPDFPYGVGLIVPDSAGNIYVSNTGLNYYIFRMDSVGEIININPNTNTLYGYIRSLYFSTENRLWVGTRVNGLFYFLNPEWAKANGGASDLQSASIFDVAISPDNKVYCSNASNIVDITGTTWAIPTCTTMGAAGSDKKLEIDSLNAVWYYNNNSFQRYAPTSPSGSCHTYQNLGFPDPLNGVNSIKAWGKNLAVGTNSGLYLYNAESGGPWLKKTNADGLLSNSVKIASGYHENLWIYDKSDTLIEIHRDLQQSMVRFSATLGNYFFAGFVDVSVSHNGVLWAIAKYNAYVGVPITFYKMIKYDIKDQVKYPLDHIAPYVSNSNPLFIEAAPDGTAWIGFPKGLVHYFPDNDSIVLYTANNSGLPSSYVNAIDFHSDGSVWIATQNGIGILRPTSDEIAPAFNMPPHICQSRPTTIINTTLGATAFEWRLDGQPIATTKNLTHTFGKPGKYILTLVARNAQGCETATSRVIEVHPAADLSTTPATWAHCDNSTQLEAPAGMAAYEWREASGQVVGTAAKLPVTQSGLYTLKVTDYCGSAATKQITVLLADCVWPGDVNADGIVDYRDWVAMTLVFGYTGPARDEQGTSFQGYPALPWNGQLPNGANIKHADADGNGVVDMADFEAIEVNYGKTHGAYPGLDGPKPSPMQFAPVILEAPTDSNGHKMTVGILAIDSSGLLNSFSGAGFVLGWNDPAPIKFAVPPAANFSIATSIGKEGSTVQSIARYLSGRNEMHLARAVTDHRNRTNVSLLAQVDFIIIEDNIGIGDTLDWVFSISGAQALTGDGAFLPIGTAQGKFTIIGDTVVVVHTNDPFQPDDFGLLVFPNPSEGVFTAILPASGSEKTALTVYDAQGRPVWRQEKAGAGAVNIDLTALPAGSYYLRAVGAKGQAVRQLMKM